MNWFDSRTKKPSSNRFDQYVVTFYSCEFSSIGLASWVPKDSYTDGDWRDVTYMNGNPVSDAEVLYWMEHPKLPNLT